MGLDGIELLMAVEDAFQIELGNIEASKCETVGQLIELVSSRVSRHPGEPCPTQHGFYTVRKVLLEVLRIHRSSITPGTRLDAIFGIQHRRRDWRQFMNSFKDQGEDVVNLARPRWMNASLVVLSFAIGISIFKLEFFFLAFMCSLVLLFIFDRLTTTFKRQFPKKYSYVRDLIRLVRTTDPHVWSKEEVSAKIKDIIVAQLGVDPSAVTMDAHFVNDLGVG